MNEEDNLIALCRSCHNEIEDLGYHTRAEIKRHTLAANVLVSAPKRDNAEERKAQRARAEREEAAEVFEWAAKWGEGFRGHVPYIKLGDPVPKTPNWCLYVYGGAAAIVEMTPQCHYHCDRRMLLNCDNTSRLGFAWRQGNDK